MQALRSFNLQSFTLGILASACDGSSGKPVAPADAGGDSGPDAGRDTDSDWGTDSDPCVPTDDDGDGFDDCFQADCDDEDPSVHPGAEDPIDDGVDQNCDGVDGVDADGDGFAGGVGEGLDCDDSDADIHPGAVWFDEPLTSGRFPALFFDGAGVAHVGYEGFEGDQYARRGDEGWETQSIMGAGVAWYVVCALGPASDFHALYAEARTLRHVTNATGEWIDEAIDPRAEEAFAIDVDESGVVHAIWSQEVGDGGSESVYGRRIAGSWETEVLEIGGSNLRVDAGGAAHLGGAGSLGVVYTTNVSGAWETTWVVEEEAVYPWSAIVLGPDDSVHLVYARETPRPDPITEYFHATNSSGAWVISPLGLDPEDFPLSADQEWFEGFSMDAAGALHLATTKRRSWGLGPNSDVLHATDAGGDWLIEVVETGEDFAGSLSIALDPGGVPSIAYSPTESSLRYAWRGDRADGVDRDCNGEDE